MKTRPSAKQGHISIFTASSLCEFLFKLFHLIGVSFCEAIYDVVKKSPVELKFIIVARRFCSDLSHLRTTRMSMKRGGT